MAFRAIVSYSAGSLTIGVNGAAAPLNDHESVESAKTQVAKYISTNKTTFQNGYDVFIIDLSAGRIVSRATLPVPTLEWKDEK